MKIRLTNFLMLSPVVFVVSSIMRWGNCDLFVYWIGILLLVMLSAVGVCDLISSHYLSKLDKVLSDLEDRNLKLRKEIEEKIGKSEF